MLRKYLLTLLLVGCTAGGMQQLSSVRHAPMHVHPATSTITPWPEDTTFPFASPNVYNEMLCDSSTANCTPNPGPTGDSDGATGQIEHLINNVAPTATSTPNTVSLNFQECINPAWNPACKPDSTYPAYFGKTSMSGGHSYTFSCVNQQTGHCSGSTGLGDTVTIPDGARGSCSGDHHATIIINGDTSSPTMYTITDWTGAYSVASPMPVPTANCNAVDGTTGSYLVVGSVSKCTTSTHGDCTPGGNAAGVPVAYSNWMDAFQIKNELTTDVSFTHPLAMSANCVKLSSSGFDYPAVDSDGMCQGHYPKEGALLWLDVPCTGNNAISSWKDSNNNDLPKWQKYIWCAAHMYGIRIVDSGGNGAVGGLFGSDDMTNILVFSPPLTGYWNYFFNNVNWGFDCSNNKCEPYGTNLIPSVDYTHFHILNAMNNPPPLRVRPNHKRHRAKP